LGKGGGALQTGTTTTTLHHHTPTNSPPQAHHKPTFSKISIRPSRSMVARICSEPGEMAKGTLALMPAASACLATLAARCMSS